MLKFLETTNMEPFKVGYFKEDIKYEPTEADIAYYSTVIKENKKHSELKSLFTKKFLMMKHPLVRPKRVYDKIL